MLSNLHLLLTWDSNDPGRTLSSQQDAKIHIKEYHKLDIRRMKKKETELVMKKITLNETAYLEYFPLEKVYDGETKPVLLILPGGGYMHLADHEAYPIADAARASGMHAIVLRYTVLTERLNDFDDLFTEITQTLDFLDSRAEEDSLDMSRVTVLGFSAGGHLAAWASHHFSDRLHRAVLCYPAARMDFTQELSMSEDEAQEHADKAQVPIEVLQKAAEFFMRWPETAIHDGTVPTFIFHSFDDGVCPVQGTIDYYSALVAAGIPSALHVFTTGGHGKSLASNVTRWEDDVEYPELQAWWSLLQDWLKLEL